MSRKRKLGIGGLVGLMACIAAVGAVRVSSEEVVPIPVQVEELKRTQNQLSVEQLMEAKMEEAQKILKGLVTHDFDQIAESAEALKLMSLKPPRGWEKKTDDDEVYEHFRSEFMRQAARLEEQARNKHLAGAAYFQQNLTATCIACHDYIRDEDLKEE
ncbi:MAG TPA: hypothetical protein PLY87_01300 [Planctomycetaceae bacterium]|nr:hypothetical protein [Planctomycetaceae bacterium]